MRFEHHSEKLATRREFFIRFLRYGAFASILIAISALAGMCGYHFIGKLQWIDSFHMSCMILTGMGPVIELKSNAAKIFSSFYALYSGVAFLSITAVFLAPVVHRFLHILHIENSDSDNN